MALNNGQIASHTATLLENVAGTLPPTQAQPKPSTEGPDATRGVTPGTKPGEKPGPKPPSPTQMPAPKPAPRPHRDRSGDEESGEPEMDPNVLRETATKIRQCVAAADEAKLAQITEMVASFAEDLDGVVQDHEATRDGDRAVRRPQE